MVFLDSFTTASLARLVADFAGLAFQ